MIDARDPDRKTAARATGRRILAALLSAGLGATALLAAGREPVPPGRRTSPPQAPATEARETRAEPPEAQAGARDARPIAAVTAAGLRLFVSHRMTEGRLVVRVGGQTVLSAPFTAIKTGPDGWFEWPLSVESGRQTVTVQVIDGAGRLVARQATDAVLAAAGTTTLEVSEHEGTGKGLTLEWRTP